MRWQEQAGSLGGEVFPKLAEQKESRIEEGHVLADPVHGMISIPPQYSVSPVAGFIKGKSAIHLARVCAGGALALASPIALLEWFLVWLTRQ